MGKPWSEEKKKALADKKVAQKEAAEQERKDMLQRQALEELRNSPIPEPKYQYEIGEVVSPRTANWNSMKVVEIIDGGKILRCAVNHTENNYGRPYTVDSLRYLSHLEVIPSSLQLAPSFSKRDHRHMSFHNQEVYGLISRHYRGKIDYSPVYQRELCWSLEDKQNLIHSIFNNTEIGKFAFIALPYSENGFHDEILDGKQRLSTLIEFYEDKFPYKGKYFSELSREDKNHFQHYNVTVGTAREDWTLKDKMEYFLRMNVSGVPQSEEHLDKVRSLLKKEK